MLLVIGMMIGTASTAHAQIDKLPHPDTTSGNFFGVAVSIDGNRALVGLRWTVQVPFAAIASVRPVEAQSPSRKTPGYLGALLLGTPP